MTTDLDPELPFIHVLDGISLEFIMGELDTITDFVNYFYVKEKIIRNKYNYSLTYAGEEELLAYFLTNRTIEDPKLHLAEMLLSKVVEINANAIALTEGLWDEYINGNSRQEYKREHKESLFFDHFIEVISNAIIAGDVGIGQNLSIRSHEVAIRTLATESRLARIRLGQHFYTKYCTNPSNSKSSLVMQSPTVKDLIYIFLLLPRDKGQKYSEYREQRAIFAQLYARVINYEKGFEKIVVIVTEPKGSYGRSEDVYFYEITKKLTARDRKELKEIKNKFGILNKVKENKQNKIRNKSSIVFSQKIPRNAKCPCQSGKKYKKCCYPKGMDELFIN